MNTITQARRLKHQKELETRQLYNRICILQAEEERAVKKIQETRQKAQQMLEYKISQEQVAKERQERKLQALTKARDLVQEKRAEALSGQAKLEGVRAEKLKEADALRKEASRHRKMIEKQEKKYLRRAQEKRFELQVMNEASKIRHEQYLISKYEAQKRQKEEALFKESKQILKNQREAKKLELLEAEVMKRLRDTHIRQQ